MLAQHRVGDERVGALDRRDVEAALGGDLRWFVGLREEAQEVDRLRRRALGHQPAVDAAERVGRRRPCRRRRSGTGTMPSLSVGDALAVGGVRLHACRAASCPSASWRPCRRRTWPADCGKVRAEVARLERLQVGELACSCLPASTKAAFLKPLILAGLGRVEGILAADAHDQIATSRNASATCRRRRRRSA